jgi:putative addiction module killer protein
MSGFPIWPTRRRRPESWLAFISVHVGAGYRVYCTRTGSTVYVLLAGGVKATQTKDIAKAKQIARELKRAKEK